MDIFINSVLELSFVVNLYRSDNLLDRWHLCCFWGEDGPSGGSSDHGLILRRAQVSVLIDGHVYPGRCQHLCVCDIKPLVTFNFFAFFVDRSRIVAATADL